VPDMVLEGTVTNVTKFGAFVDIGVHQDGLVHISELADRYVTDPAEVVKVGQIVKVKVLSVDARAKRIALSMKALQGTPAKPKAERREAPQTARPVQPPQLRPTTMNDKLATLSSKWKTR